MDWIMTHLPEALMAALAGALTLVQIAPIKINPWSAVGRGVGRFLGIEAVQTKLDAHIKLDDERFIKQCRLRILRFADESLQGERHTKEHFEEIMDDSTEYGRYCRTHQDFENSKAVLAIENVKETYKKCQTDKDFFVKETSK